MLIVAFGLGILVGFSLTSFYVDSNITSLLKDMINSADNDEEEVDDVGW